MILMRIKIKSDEIEESKFTKSVDQFGNITISFNIPLNPNPMPKLNAKFHPEYTAFLEATNAN